MSTPNEETSNEPGRREVNREFLPRYELTEERKSLWEIFLLGWSHFIPSLPINDDPPPRRRR